MKRWALLLLRVLWSVFGWLFLLMSGILVGVLLQLHVTGPITNPFGVFKLHFKWMATRHVDAGTCFTIKSGNEHFCFEKSKLYGATAHTPDVPYFYVRGSYAAPLYNQKAQDSDKTVFFSWEEIPPKDLPVRGDNYVLHRLQYHLPDDLGQGAHMDTPQALMAHLAKHFTVHQTARYRHITVPYEKLLYGDHRATWRILLIDDGELFIWVHYGPDGHDGNIYFTTRQPNFYGWIAMHDVMTLSLKDPEVIPNYDQLLWFVPYTRTWKQSPDIELVYQVIWELVGFLDYSRVKNGGENGLSHP